MHILDLLARAVGATVPPYGPLRLRVTAIADNYSL